MSENAFELKRDGLGATERRDAWWLEPLLVAVGFTAFIIYTTWAAFQDPKWAEPEGTPYLSPFFSPKFNFSWWHWSPALLILWIPAAFRGTCYYYRKAYYRAYFLDPPACAVGEPRNSYSGETKFPWILQNLHRYFFYLATAVLFILWYDALVAFFWKDGFHVGVGALIMVGNCVLLSGYSFGCHCMRHLIGGKLDCFSCTASAKKRFGLWQQVTKLNEHHMLWAWTSLASVMFTDVYIRLVAMGIWHDVRIF